MQYVNRKLIRIKERELATLDERTCNWRSMLEREPPSLDEQSQQEREQLEQDIRALQRAAEIEERTLTTLKAHPKGHTKREREDLFEIRKQVMRRLLDEAHRGEVHVRDLAEALNRAVSTVKDYYSEQLEIRPSDCFWEHGVDKAHFRWKGGAPPPSGSSRVTGGEAG